jgi:quercetin dioxygenase-like cupin family protein
MTTQTLTFVRRNMDAPDDRWEFNNGKIEFAELEDAKIVRATFKPGWRWTKDVKPSMRKNLSRYRHTVYVISGRLIMQAEDGTECELKPGDCTLFVPGNDAWVLGDEPFIGIGVLSGSLTG